MRYIKDLSFERKIYIEKEKDKAFDYVAFCPELNEYILIIIVPWIAYYERYYWISNEDYELVEKDVNAFKEKYKEAFSSIMDLPKGITFMGSTALRDYEGRERFYTYFKPGTVKDINTFQHFLYEDRVLYAHILMDGIHYAVLPYRIIKNEKGEYVRPLEKKENVEMVSITSNGEDLKLFSGIKVDTFEGFDTWKEEFDNEKSNKPLFKEKTLQLIKNHTIDELFAICVLKEEMYKRRFDKYVGDVKGWSVNKNIGKMYINEKIIDVEYMGKTIIAEKCWYSADIDQEIPDRCKELLKKTKECLSKLGYNEMTNSKIDLNNSFEEFYLPIIYAAFATERTIYFLGANSEKAVYMFLKNLPDELFKKPDYEEIFRTITAVSKHVNIDHMLMVKALLTEYDYNYEEKENEINIIFPENITMNIIFDNDKKIIQINSYV